jgi:hypothetical protein
MKSKQTKEQIKMIKELTYYKLTKNSESGETNWNDFKEIKSWAKSNHYECFEINNYLILKNDDEVIFYFKHKEKKS